MANKIVNQIKKVFASQLAIPLVALIVLVVFNLIRDPSFFSIVIKKNNLGNTSPKYFNKFIKPSNIFFLIFSGIGFFVLVAYFIKNILKSN